MRQVAARGPSSRVARAQWPCVAPAAAPPSARQPSVALTAASTRGRRPRIELPFSWSSSSSHPFSHSSSSSCAPRQLLDGHSSVPSQVDGRARACPGSNVRACLGIPAPRPDSGAGGRTPGELRPGGHAVAGCATAGHKRFLPPTCACSLSAWAMLAFLMLGPTCVWIS